MGEIVKPMKKIILINCLLLPFALCAQEQKSVETKNPEMVRMIHENLFRAGINTNPYEYLPTTETPVPKGYKPFYISHYGRHGSRSDWAGTAYPALLDRYSKASEAGLLTTEGESAFARVKEIIRLHAGMDGRLTRRGASEHRQIAGRMYTRYKGVFHDGSRRVRAISSIAPCCIVSMAAFTGELLSRDSHLDISWDTGSEFMKICSTEDSRDVKKKVQGILDEQAAAHVPDTASFMRRVFKDPAAARSIVGDPVVLMRHTFDIAAICGFWPSCFLQGCRPARKSGRNLLSRKRQLHRNKMPEMMDKSLPAWRGLGRLLSSVHILPSILLTFRRRQISAALRISIMDTAVL